MSARAFDAAEVAAEFGSAGLQASVDAPFGELTTYGVGGRAAVMVEVVSAADAVAAGQVMSRLPGTPVFALGNGSNTLVADGGFGGVVVRTRPPRDPAAMTVRMVDGTVSVGGWMPLPVLARRSVAAGARGLEWAVGVPGTVGGAVRMNAGGHGAEMVDSLVSVRVVSIRTGVSVEVAAGELGLHFREPRGDHDSEGELAAVVTWRREHQPGGRNAGSVFVNPSSGEGSAGALLDAAGMRGRTVGSASVSEKHANFIQSGNGATADQILVLMGEMQDAVRERTGITLRSEVRMVGFDAQSTARFAAGHDAPAVTGAREHLRDL
ncbi:MAG: FAD-binding protein, partial [Actinobacteria bacterium]|nr:FAD-binding protein [Actinomycetota bacterium]